VHFATTASTNILAATKAEMKQRMRQCH